MNVQLKLARTAARAQRRLPAALLRRRHGEPPTIDGHALDLQIWAFQQLSVKAQARSADPDVPPTPESIRTGFDTMAAIASGEAVEAVSVHDRTIPGPVSDIPVRLYHPTHTEGRADAIVWFHQGGGVIGGLDTDHTLCTMLSESCQAVVLSVDYRLAPEHPFPAGLVDSVAAYQWVIDNADGLGVDPARVAVGGTSEGGRLAVAIGQGRRRDGLSVPLAQIVLYPWLDLTAAGGSVDSMAEAWPLNAGVLQFFAMAAGVDAEAAVDPGVSPGLAADLAGTPPSLVVTAGYDPLRDQGNDYANRLQEAGIATVTRCEAELTHSFTIMGAVSKAAQKATERIAADAAKLLADA